MKKLKLTPFDILWQVHNPTFGLDNTNKLLFLLGWFNGLLTGDVISSDEFKQWVAYLEIYAS